MNSIEKTHRYIIAFNLTDEKCKELENKNVYVLGLVHVIISSEKVKKKTEKMAKSL